MHGEEDRQQVLKENRIDSEQGKEHRQEYAGTKEQTVFRKKGTDNKCVGLKEQA